MSADPEAINTWSAIGGLAGGAVSGFIAGLKARARRKPEAGELEELRRAFRELREAQQKFDQQRLDDLEDCRRQWKECEENSRALREKVEELQTEVGALKTFIAGLNLSPPRRRGTRRGAGE